MLLLLTQKKLRTCKHEFYTVCNLEDIQSFTLIQLVLCICIFVITLTPAAMVFPMLIGILIPFRLITMPKYYESHSLNTLDPFIDHDEHNEEDLAHRVIVDNDDEDLAVEVEEKEVVARSRNGSAASNSGTNSGTSGGTSGGGGVVVEMEMSNNKV